MDSRQQWQALQTHLSAARRAEDAGDRSGALEHIDAALAIDESFLAAQSFRERLLSQPDSPAPPRGSKEEEKPAEAAAVPTRALVSTESYAKFEQRAMRRRVDRRVEAARSALQRGRLKQAAVALDEVIELDANLPELASLTAEFDQLRRNIAGPRRGPWLAAGAVFTVTVLAATWLEERGSLASRTFFPDVPLVAAPSRPALIPEPIQLESPVVADTIETVAVPRADAPRAEVRTPPPPAAAFVDSTGREGRRDVVSSVVSAPRAADVEPTPRVVSSDAALRVLSPELARPANPEPPTNVEARTSRAEPAAPAAPSPPIVAPATADEEQLIRQTLQRYRRAYEGLDAQSAQAVYPAINEAALTRAFDDLSSQSLTFDVCDVSMHGGNAVAICHGTASYVPKIGSRERRVEPRVWNFTLAKQGADWKIENARAER